MAIVKPIMKNKPNNFNAVAFHSDDWGYCGWVPNSSIYENLRTLYEKNYGPKVKILGKTTLETPENLEKLFNVLERYTDVNGRHPVFQSAYIVTNPDYAAVLESGASHYIDVSLPGLPTGWERGDIIGKANEGISRGVWMPVYHGASHFHPGRWLERIATDKDEQYAAKYSCFLGSGMANDFEFAGCAGDNGDKERLERGIATFKQLFCFLPEVVVCPCYEWQNSLESVLGKYGIRYLQGKNLQQNRPSLLDKTRGKLLNLFGLKDSAKVWQIETGDYSVSAGLYYVSRNVYFEPYEEPAIPIETIVDRTLKRIFQLWESGQPAVLVSHRANYVSLDNVTMERGLMALNLLLKQLSSPQNHVRFLTDQELVRAIASVGN